MHKWMAVCCAKMHAMISVHVQRRELTRVQASLLQVDKLGFRVPQFEPTIRAGTAARALFTCAPNQLWEVAQHNKFRMMLKGLQVASSQVRQQCSQSTAAAKNERQQLRRCVYDWMRRLLGRLLVSLRV